MELSSVLTLLSHLLLILTLQNLRLWGCPCLALVGGVLARPIASFEIHSQCLAKILTFGLNNILVVSGASVLYSIRIPTLAWSLGDAVVK